MTTDKIDAYKLIAGLALLTATAVSVQAAPQFAPGEILFKPAAGLSEEKINHVVERSHGQGMRRLRGLEVRLMKVPEGQESRIAEALHRNPNIVFAEPNYKLPPVASANDPEFSKQWHLPKIQAPAAWDYSDGTGVTVAVLDSGVYASHPDLSGRVVRGWNTVSNNSDTADIHGHGTWVAGTVAAIANNGIGVASTAPGANIMPIRITNSSDGTAYASDMAEGITWATDNGARIANISYEGVVGNYTVENAATYMMNKGGIVVVAAGNSGTDLGYSNSPYMFVASATDSSDNKAGYSNYGQYIDVAAPGSAIYTTNRDGGYSNVQGTSFASPNAAAVAALVMAANPSLTPTDVTAVISNTATDLGTTNWDPYYGHGRVNALAAVQLAASVETSDRTAPNVAVSSPGANQTVRGQVAVNINASDNFGVSSVDLVIDGVRFASETQGQNGVYRFSWDSTNVADGKHRISARAIDAAGNTGASSDVYVNVSNINDSVAPTVTITSPADGEIVSGNVILSGYGSDDQAMSQFNLSVNGQLQCTGGTSASCGWNTRKLSDGTYTIRADAIDHAGNVGSTQIGVIVGGTTSDNTTDSGSSKPGKGIGRSK